MRKWIQHSLTRSIIAQEELTFSVYIIPKIILYVLMQKYISFCETSNSFCMETKHTMTNSDIGVYLMNEPEDKYRAVKISEIAFGFKGLYINVVSGFLVHPRLGCILQSHLIVHLKKQ